MGEEVQIQEKQTERTKVGFPEAPEPKQGGFSVKTFFIFLIILLLLGAGAWFFFGRNKAEPETAGETPTVAEETQEETPTPEQQTVDKKNLKIQILNGSGISGAAGKLQTKLKDLGYTNFEVGNASAYSFTSTEVAYGKSVPSAVKDEITSELEDLYSKVTATDTTSTKFDIIITVGYPKNYSPTPTSKPKVTTAVTPTSNVSGTITPTRTPSKTPTPTP